VEVGVGPDLQAAPCAFEGLGADGGKLGPADFEAVEGASEEVRRYPEPGPAPVLAEVGVADHPAVHRDLRPAGAGSADARDGGEPGDELEVDGGRGGRR